MSNDTLAAGAQPLPAPLALLLFTRRLATFIESGLALSRSLNCLVHSELQPYTVVARKLLQDVMRGHKFSDAMKAHPHYFNGFYISMVRAGEVGGVLDITLRRVADLMTKEWKITQTRPAGEQPLLIIGATQEVPAQDWAGLSAYQQAVSSVLFFDAFGVLLSSGVPIVQTMEIVSGLLPQQQAQQFLQVRESVLAGETLKMEHLGFVPPFALELMALGEETGTLDIMLQKIADLFEHEMECRALMETPRD